MGLNYTLPGDLDLWYYDWNQDPSFADFKPFGGWTAPTLKQYNANLNVCGTLSNYTIMHAGSHKFTHTLRLCI